MSVQATCCASLQALADDRTGARVAKSSSSDIACSQSTRSMFVADRWRSCQKVPVRRRRAVGADDRAANNSEACQHWGLKRAWCSSDLADQAHSPRTLVFDGRRKEVWAGLAHRCYTETELGT